MNNTLDHGEPFPSKSETDKNAHSTSGTKDMTFTEILLPSKEKQTNESENNKEDLFVEAFAALVEPQLCGPLIRQLQTQQDELLHLKRVKIAPAAYRHDEDALKRQKLPEQRLVLLGTVHMCSETIERWSRQYNLQTVLIPKRPPNSECEWKLMNEKWPTKRVNYLAIEQEQQAKRIPPKEYSLMEKIIQQVLLEDDTVIVDPSSADIVGRASAERLLQLGTEKGNNPLQTDIIYAIQNVSRRERIQPDGSYLCTGFDLYTVQEPSLFEGMAALHSRVRRIIFVYASPSGALTHYSLHTLPSTNHHFRGFQWNGGKTKIDTAS